MYDVLCLVGPGDVRGVYQQPAGVETDPPPVLLGADVDSLLPAGVAAGVPLRRPAVQREPLVQGEHTLLSEEALNKWLMRLSCCLCL